MKQYFVNVMWAKTELIIITEKEIVMKKIFALLALYNEGGCERDALIGLPPQS